MLGCRGSPGLPRPEHRAVRRGRRRRSSPRPRRSSPRSPVPGPDEGPWLDAAAVAKAAQAELDRYRAFAPDLESHVEVREGSTGVMVSNGDVLIAPDLPRGRRPHRGPAAPRGRHPRRHPRQRRPPAAARAGQRAGRPRRDPGGAGRPRRAPRRRASRPDACASSRPGWSPCTRWSRACHVRGRPRRARRRGHPRRPGVHDHHARVPLRRAHQGRRVPAGAARAGRPPGRRRRPRRAVARQDAAHGGPARRRAARAGRARRPAAAAALPRRPGAPGAAGPPPRGQLAGRV